MTLIHPDATEKIDVENELEPVDMKDWQIGEDGKIATSNLSRLAPGARLTVQSTYPIEPGYFLDETCTVTVAYKDGFIEENPCSPVGLGSEWELELLFIIPLVVSSTVAGGLLTFREVRKRIKDNRKDRFIRDLIKEVKRFQDKVRLKNSAQSIFNSKLWDSKGINERREIFNNYDDYKKIENFYDCVDRRHSAFLQKDINNEMIERYNNECLNSADAVSQIDWKKYGINTMSINRSSTIAKVLIGSLLVTYACQGGLFYFYSVYGITGLYSSEFFLIILFLSRGIVSFLVLIPILRTSNLVYSAQAGGNESNLLQMVRHSKLGLARLLLASIALMGLSIFVVLFGLILVLNMFQVADILPNPYYIIAIDTPVDVLRMILMVFVVPRWIVRMKGRRIGQIVLTRMGLKHTDRII